MQKLQYNIVGQLDSTELDKLSRNPEQALIFRGDIINYALRRAHIRSEYGIEGVSLVPALTGAVIDHFWDAAFKDTGNHISLAVKTKYANVGHKTLSPTRFLSYDDKEAFKLFLTARIELINEEYSPEGPLFLQFAYFKGKGPKPEGVKSLTSNTSPTELKAHASQHKHPISMLPEDYGQIMNLTNSSDTNSTECLVLNRETGHTYEIKVLSENTNHVTIAGPTGYEWTDTSMEVEGRKILKRELHTKALYFDLVHQDKVLETSVVYSPNTFTKSSTDEHMAPDNSFMTIDIETVLNENNQHRAYLICGYTRGKYIYSQASDTQDVSIESMYHNFIQKIIDMKDIKYVYAHNFSRFDGFLLFRPLASFVSDKYKVEIKPHLFHGRLIHIKLKLMDSKGKYLRTIIFKDSYLLLPLSLRKLCEAFQLSSKKSHLPYGLDNINYSGAVPDISLWDGITVPDFNKILKSFSNKIWNFKDEALKYCKLDCKLLYEVLVIFNNLIFEQFKIDTHKRGATNTLPGLAMKIYKTNFMPEGLIHQLTGKVAADIREPYTGGAVDVYIPSNYV